MDKNSFSKRKIAIIPEPLKKLVLSILEIPVAFIVRLNMHPNFFTGLGFFITCFGAYLYCVKSLRLAGIFILLGGIFDIIDGKVARQSGLSSKFGAIFDSTLDRYSEFVMFFGIGVYFARQNLEYSALVVIVAFLALGGSMLVSYVRARAEGLGYDCKVGIMQRPERIVYLSFASVVHEYVLIAMLFVVAVLANYTVVQRMFHVKKMEEAELNDPESG